MRHSAVARLPESRVVLSRYNLTEVFGHMVLYLLLLIDQDFILSPISTKTKTQKEQI
jgi:hypothetical protein